MKPNTLTLTGDGAGTTNTSPLRVNWRAETTSLSLATDGSTTGFTAQYTLTPPDSYATAAAWAAAAQWHAAFSGTAANSGVLVGPVHGVRLQANANGTDTGTLHVAQSDC